MHVTSRLLVEQARCEVNRVVRQGHGRELIVTDRQEAGEQGCTICGHYIMQLAASERRAGDLARCLDELRDARA